MAAVIPDRMRNRSQRNRAGALQLSLWNLRGEKLNCLFQLRCYSATAPPLLSRSNFNLFLLTPKCVFILFFLLFLSIDADIYTYMYLIPYMYVCMYQVIKNYQPTEGWMERDPKTVSAKALNGFSVVLMIPCAWIHAWHNQGLPSNERSNDGILGNIFP